MNHPLLVIDADSLIYRVGWSNTSRSYVVWDKEDEEYGPVCSFKYKKDAKKWINGENDRFRIEKEEKEGDFKEARSYIDNILDSIIWRYRTNRYKIYLSDGNVGTFRHKLDPEYKKSRDPSNKPPHYQLLVDHLCRHWMASVVGGIEADDAVAIECTNDSTAVCVSIDKDLDQVPGHHFNPNTKREYFITPEEGVTNLYVQALEGDRVDDIVGVKGVGRAKALKLLEPLKGDEKKMWWECSYLYKGDYERLNKNLELLYLLRTWEDKWEPPITIEEIRSEVNSS